jgi:hypothetical protein
MNAIAMHPGFSLPAYPTWRDALDTLKPGVICFCAYRPSEMERDIDFLVGCGYYLNEQGCNEEFRIPIDPEDGGYYCNVWAIVTRV